MNRYIKVYMQEPIYILREGIVISWDIISQNPNAFYILQQYHDKISYDYLCKNTNEYIIRFLLTKNREYIDWTLLSANPTNTSLDLLEANIDKINWIYLSENTNERAIDLLEANIDKINWHFFSKNQNPRAIKLLQKYDNKIDWKWFSMNTADEAIYILSKNIDKIFWKWFSCNPHPQAIKMIEMNLDKVDWYWLSRNPSAIHLLHKHKDKIHWEGLLSNTSKNAVPFFEEYLAAINNLDWNYQYIHYTYKLGVNPYALHLLFTYDYEKMMYKNQLFNEELVKYVFYPPRLIKMSTTYKLDLSEYIELIT